MMKLFAQSLLMVALAQAAVEETCTQEATLSESSAHDVGMYSYNPITMVNQDQTTVTVTIDQSWTDGPLGGLKVLYGSGGEMECATSLGLEGASAEYTADCVDGVALFGLFAGDDSFSGVTDISGDFPDECMVDGEAGPTYDKYASFMFRVPCDASDESFCPGKLCTDNEPPEGYAFCYQMYNAGTQNSESKNYIESSKAYCKNDCENDRYCFYVVAESGYYLADEEAWFKDYSTGNSVIPADGGINFIKDDNGNTIAWEGCFDLPDGADGASIEIHANFGPFGQTAGSTSSTGKRTGKDTSTVSIDYGTCEAPVDPPVDSPVLPPFSSANNNQGDDDDEPCVPEARLRDTSADQVGMFASNPIVLGTQDVDSVTVTISQTWKDGALGGLKTMYTTTDGGMTCNTEYGVDSSSESLTAKCIDGVASLVVLAGDSSFTGVEDITATFPDYCVKDDALEAAIGNDHYTMFAFDIPCDPTDESFCPDKLCEDDEETPAETPVEEPVEDPVEDPVEEPTDECPDDPDKTEEGTCGCGVPETDSDGDGTPDCVDVCPNDAAMTESPDTDNDGTPDCEDVCPNDPTMTDSPDTDNDGTPDCEDVCPNDPTMTESPDTDNDGTPDCEDKCPNDASMTDSPDTDNDGTPDCEDQCPNDPTMTESPDTDDDGTPDCEDQCPNDPTMTESPDTDNDGTPDCEDKCPNDPTMTDSPDTDNDGTPDCEDRCPNDPTMTESPDTDEDGTPDCEDKCPTDPTMTDSPDTDGDGTLDCNDECIDDPDKTEPGQCGCGVADDDLDGDGDIDCSPVDSPVLPPFSSGNNNQGPPTDDSDDDGEDGGGFGDPHLKTWTGEVYDFHGACDLVLVQSNSFHNGAGINVHIRTIMRDDWSFISSAAIRIGEDIFEVGQHANYWLNGVGGVDLPDTVGGFPVVKIHHGDRRTLFQIDLGHMGLYEVRVFGEFLAVEFHKAHQDGFLDSQGLMGRFTDGKLVGRSGEIVADHNEFGLSWQVRDTDPNLFQHEVGPQYPQLCDMPEAKTLKERRMSESMVSFEDAEKACADWDEATKESCIYDVMATGDLSMAQAGAF